MFLKIFGLSHHKHSGKRLPHAHTSYFGLAAITLFAGIIPALIVQSAASADPPPVSNTVAVNANVNTIAPTITTPVNGQQFDNSQIIVSGTCQPDFIVGVFKNDIVAGSTVCQSDGTFSLRIDLLVGENDLYARHFRPGAVSPESNHVIIYYRAVIASTPITTTDDSSQTPVVVSGITTEKQLVIISEESAKAQPFGKSLTWKIRVEGGLAPYALSWDWGDGTSELKSLNQAGEFLGKHTYAAAGNYTIKIKAVDSKGQTATLELTAIATGLNIINQLERNITDKTNSSLLWQSLATLFIVFISFWLGEHYRAWRSAMRRRMTRRHA